MQEPYAKIHPDDRPIIQALAKSFDWELEQLDEHEFNFPRMGYLLDTANRVTGLALDHIPWQVTWADLPGRLPLLKILSLKRCEISDTAPLASLSALTTLYLGDNQISDIAPLASLSALTHLSLHNNQISDTAPLASLSALTHLYLHNNQISDTAPLASLSALTELYLENNQISDTAPLASLSALTKLNLGGNQISNTAPLTSLSALTLLYLYNNQISDTAPLASLSALTKLHLGGNQISDTAPLTSLSALTTLDLSNNHLTQIPGVMCARFDKITDRLWVGEEGLCLGGNPLRHPPIELVARGKEAVDAWFQVFETHGARELGQLKVLLLGDGAAGKTSLVERLVHNTFNEHQPQTDGIRVVSWQPKLTDDNLLVKFWDFGGQEIMHATHQIFLSKRCLYVIVQSARHVDKTAYWLRHAATFGGDAPVLVVVNQIDQNPGFRLDEHQLQRDYPNLIGFYRISCKTRKGLRDLTARLAQELPRVELAHALWPEPWFGAKQHMEELDEPYIDRERAHHICKLRGIVDDIQQKVFLEYLHDLGVMLSFPDPHLRLTKVLNPHWATKGIYAIINADQLAEDHGRLPFACLGQLLDPDRYPAHTHEFLIALMRKFELCYPLEEQQAVMVPNLLPKTSPKKLDLPGSGNELQFLFHYPEFLPPSIFLRTMVRLYRDIDPKRKSWRQGVFLSHGQNQALITEDPDQRALKIRVRGPRQRDYFNLLYYIIRGINEGFADLEWTEKVPLPDDPALHMAAPYNVLTNMDAANQPDYFAPNNRTYKVPELLGTIRGDRPNKEKIAEKALTLHEEVTRHPEAVAEKEEKELIRDIVTKTVSISLGPIKINLEPLLKYFYEKFKSK